MSRPNVWTLASALPIIRDLELALKEGFHVALGGSVLYKGFSEKDLDIVVLPHKSEKGGSNFDLAKTAIETHFQRKLIDCSTMSKRPRDAKKVFWLRDPLDRRIDFFFLE